MTHVPKQRAYYHFLTYTPISHRVYGMGEGQEADDRKGGGVRHLQCNDGERTHGMVVVKEVED